MEVPAEVQHPIVKSVLVFALAAMVLSFVAGLASGFLAASHLQSYLLSALVNLTCMVVSTIAGAGWFKFKMERGMSPAERLSFASGVLVTNLILNVGITGLVMLLSGPAEVARYGGRAALFADYIYGTVLTWAFLFLHVLLFTQAYFVGWIITRNSAGDRRRELERVFGDT